MSATIDRTVPAYEIESYPANGGKHWRWRTPGGAWSRGYNTFASAQCGALHTLRYRATKSTRGTP